MLPNKRGKGLVTVERRKYYAHGTCMPHHISCYMHTDTNGSMSIVAADALTLTHSGLGAGWRCSSSSRNSSSKLMGTAGAASTMYDQHGGTTR